MDSNHSNVNTCPRSRSRLKASAVGVCSLHKRQEKQTGSGDQTEASVKVSFIVFKKKKKFLFDLAEKQLQA